MLRTDMVEWICRGQTPPILPPSHLIPETFNQQVHLAPCSSVILDKEKRLHIMLHSYYRILQELLVSRV